MRAHTRLPLLYSLAALALASGCLTPLMMANSTTPMDGRVHQVVGPTEAESCIVSILGIPISTDASLNTTLRLARERIQADALIEVVVDQWALTTLFYNENCTRVHAVGVRFTGQPAPFLEPGPAVPRVPALPAAPTQPAQPAATAEPAQPAQPAAAEPAQPAQPVQPAKKLTRAERRRLAAEERRRQAEEKRKAREEARRKAEEDKKAKTEEAQAKVEAARQAAEQAKRQAEEDKRAAELARRQAEESQPVPAEFAIFCKYQPGQPILVETKAEKIEADFVKCVHSGVRLKKADQEPSVVLFDTIWSVHMRAAETSGPTATPAMPATPAQPNP